MGQPTLRSPLLDVPNAIFSPKTTGGMQKGKKARDLGKEKTLDGGPVLGDPYGYEVSFSCIVCWNPAAADSRTLAKVLPTDFQL